MCVNTGICSLAFEGTYVVVCIIRNRHIMQRYELFLCDHAPEMQYDGFFYVGKINRHAFVEGVGAVFVLVYYADGALLAGSEGAAGPFNSGAAAGGDCRKYGEGLVPDVGNGEYAALGAVLHGDRSEIVNGLVELGASSYESLDCEKNK